MEKFVTDLDQILDDFENDDAFCSDFNSSGYNSLKTSSEFATPDADLLNSSGVKVCEMSQIPEMSTPTISDHDYSMDLYQDENSDSQNSLVANIDDTSIKNDIELKSSIEQNFNNFEHELTYSEDFLECSKYSANETKFPSNDSSNLESNSEISNELSSTLINFNSDNSSLNKNKRKRPGSLMVINSNNMEKTFSETTENNDNTNCVTSDKFSFLSNTATSTNSKRPKTLNLTPSTSGEQFQTKKQDTCEDNECVKDKSRCVIEESNSEIMEPNQDLNIADSDFIIDSNMTSLESNNSNNTNLIESTTKWQGIPINQLGKQQPTWIPDEFTNNCMECSHLFTVFRRRHHCRSCGRLLCAKCCCWRTNLSFTTTTSNSSHILGYRDRVCAVCYTHLVRIESLEKQSVNNNISDRGLNTQSGVSSVTLSNNPNSVLKSTKRPGSLNLMSSINDTALINNNLNYNSISNSNKFVMFADGIRPGGDLVESDKPRIITPTTLIGLSSAQSKCQSNPIVISEPALVESDKFMDTVINLVQQNILEKPINDVSEPIVIGINENLKVTLLLISLPFCSCISNTSVNQTKLNIDNIDPVTITTNTIEGVCQCPNVECWYFASTGLKSVGYEEIVLVVKRLESEVCPPRDLFIFYHLIYQKALRDETRNLGGGLELSVQLIPRPINTTTTNSIQSDWPAILLIHPTFQTSLDHLYQTLPANMIPRKPYLFGLLVHRWELQWAMLLPLRLLLALGYQSRYYPCPLINDRLRSPTFYEPVPTILQIINQSLLTTNQDLNNSKFLAITDLHIHLLPQQQSIISIPQSAYSSVVELLSNLTTNMNSNQYSLALTACFNTEADSHLVCCQGDNSYITRAISIQNTERKVTGATMALFVPTKSSHPPLGCSIIEDILVIRLNFIQWDCVLQSLKSMRDTTLEITSVLAGNNLEDSLCAPDQFHISSTFDYNSTSINTNNNKSILKIVWKEDNYSLYSGIGSIQAQYMSRVTPNQSIVDSLYSCIGLQRQESNLTSSMPNVISHKVPHSIQISNNISSPYFVWTLYHYIYNKSSKIVDSYHSNYDDVPDCGQLIHNLALRFMQAISPYRDILRQSKILEIGLRIKLDNDKAEWWTGCVSSTSNVAISPTEQQDTLLIEPLPEICLELLNDDFVPYLYSLSSSCDTNSVPLTNIVTELEFHIVD